MSKLPSQSFISGIPMYQQAELQCGPAALAMAITWAGIPRRPEEITDSAYTAARAGSFQIDLINSTRRLGRLPYVINPDFATLLQEIAAGNPVVVLQNRGLNWFPFWHYAVVVGYDLQRSTVALYAGGSSPEQMSFHVFDATWDRAKRWGMLVLPPNRLPVTAQELEYLDAVSGLERTDHWDEAITAYKTALVRWPSSEIAAVGLSNAFLQRGDFLAAKEVLSAGLVQHPKSSALLNNFAHILLEQGELGEALLYARRAVAIGGPYRELCQKTLAAIQQQLTQDEHFNNAR